jgi:protein-S-isoprenylcysteine O-methyltransferase Ste14
MLGYNLDSWRMYYFYHWFFQISWLLFVAYWIISAPWAKRIKVREPLSVLLAYRPIAWLAMLILIFPQRFPPLQHPLWPQERLTFYTGAVIMLAGLAFAVWARIHLGRYWSASVALKQDHQLIRSGPYQFVRHPIYTGILAGLLGTVIALGHVNGIIAFILFSLCFWWKSRFEETLMIQTFGDQYLQYRKEVPALVPWPKW